MKKPLDPDISPSPESFKNISLERHKSITRYIYNLATLCEIKWPSTSF